MTSRSRRSSSRRTIVVNLEDVAQWATYSVVNSGDASSWYDFNFDGMTNTEDFEIIKANFGRHCKAPPPPG